jgi:hypothetical protein
MFFQLITACYRVSAIATLGVRIREDIGLLPTADTDSACPHPIMARVFEICMVGPKGTDSDFQIEAEPEHAFEIFILSSTARMEPCVS